MRLQLAASRWRVVPVVLGSTVTFIAFAIFVYWLYFTNRGAVYDYEGIVALQVLFYVAFMVHLLGSFGAAAALTIWTRVPMYPTLKAVGVTFAILMFPLVYVLSAFNMCATGVSFPIPGFGCD